MNHRNISTIGALALVLAAGACNREVSESRATVERENGSRSVDRTAELQREHDQDITRLDERVAALDREYAETNQKVVSGGRTATAGLREEVKEDLANVKKAVSDLRTTTPDNWWDRHEQAMNRTANDIEEDVRRLAGSITPARPRESAGTTGEGVSTAPFTSRRDKFVAELRARVDAMEQSLDKVKTRGAKETEVEDARARVKKLGDDVDRLRSASADEWWDVTKARVTEYLDRVEGSVNRLDDNKG